MVDPEAEPGYELSLASTVAEWRIACDLVPWKRLAESLSVHYRISRPMAEWENVLEPAKERTLAEVTAFISRHGLFPRVRFTGAFGTRSAAAGVFAALQVALRHDGAPARVIRPSTLLGLLAKNGMGTLIQLGADLAPGALPNLHPTAKRFWLIPSGWSFELLHTVRDYCECIARAIDCEASAPG